MRHDKVRKVLEFAPFERQAAGECVADDPGSFPAPRPRRRRRAQDEGPAESLNTPIDKAPLAPPETSDSMDVTPLPTFLNAASSGTWSMTPPIEAPAGAEVDVGQGSAWGAPADADPARDGEARWIIGRAVPNTPVVPSPVDHGWLPMLEDRSPNPEVCPFLRAVDETDRLILPVEAPDPANRCAALREAVPQSLRQQELVCLASGHVNCPRYLRGAVVIAEAPDPVVKTGRTITPAILGSLLVLVMALSASVAFVMSRGGMELAAAVPTASPASSVAVVAQASATPALTNAPTATRTPTPAPTPSPSPTPSATPSLAPTPTPRPTAKPTAQPVARSNRYDVLRACPSTPNCWIYTVRSGDNLYSIANWFGISLDSIYARNPWTRTQPLRAGQELRLPPPTR